MKQKAKNENEIKKIDMSTIMAVKPPPQSSYSSYALTSGSMQMAKGCGPSRMGGMRQGAAMAMRGPPPPTLAMQRPPQ